MAGPRTGLVIDASVAGAAGKSEHPPSSMCRGFLEEARKICHKLVMTNELREEWKNHSSAFTLRWWRSMFARKKIERLGSVQDDNLRVAICAAAQTGGKREEMLKDVHLLEAALQVRCPIISIDDHARELFTQAAQKVPRLRQIMWVNPTKSEERALDWLREGAQPDAGRCLGFGSCE